MIGDGGVRVASALARFSDLVECWASVAPLGMHLQITAITVGRRSGQAGIPENPEDFGTTQEVSSERTPSVDLGAAVGAIDGLLDSR